MLDSLRTGLVWLFGLASGAEHFHLLQILGFALMVTGTTTHSSWFKASPLPDDTLICSPGASWSSRRSYAPRSAA